MKQRGEGTTFDFRALLEKQNRTRLAVVLGGNSKDRRDSSARRLIEAGFRHPSSPNRCSALWDGGAEPPRWGRETSPAASPP